MRPPLTYSTRRQRDDSQRTGDDGLLLMLAAAIDLARRDAALDPDSLSDPTDRRRARRNQRTAQEFLQDFDIPIVPVTSH